MPDVEHVNIFAVVVAGLVGFFFGGLWYSKALFCEVWARESGIVMPKPGEKPARHPLQMFSIGIAFSLIAAFAFAAWIGPSPSLSNAVTHGVIVGACFVASSFGINYAFAGKSWQLWMIDGGYHLVQFTLFGVVLGLWH